MQFFGSGWKLLSEKRSFEPLGSESPKVTRHSNLERQSCGENERLNKSDVAESKVSGVCNLA